MLNALVIVIFGLLLTVVGAGVLVLCVVRMFLTRIDTAINLLADGPEPRTTESPKKVKVFKRPQRSDTPELVGIKSSEENATADLVTHKNVTTDSGYIPVDQVDKELLSTAIDAYRGYLPEKPVEAE